MTSIFIKLLNLSISAGMLVLLVFVFRLFLKRYSRRAACLLWIVVALRLIIPFSFESRFSIMPSGDFVSTAVPEEESRADTNVVLEDTPYIENNSNNVSASNTDKTQNESDVSDTNVITEVDNNALLIQSTSEYENRKINTNNNVAQNRYSSDYNRAYDIQSAPGFFVSERFWKLLTYVWLFGVAAILLYIIIGYVRIKKLTAESVPYGELGIDNVFICNRIDTAFIFGIINPRIYLPERLDRTQSENIVAHELVHIKRKDYLWKLIGFILLMVYWFNPVMWLAYVLLCRDIEFACDEQVISGMNTDQIKAYSDTLLLCSTDQNFSYGCPLAFGEVAVKDRIKAALSYKKPLFWVLLAVFILLVGMCVFFFIKPSGDKNITSQSEDNNKDYIAINNSIPYIPDIEGSENSRAEALIADYMADPDKIKNLTFDEIRAEYGDAGTYLYGSWADVIETQSGDRLVIYYDDEGKIEEVKRETEPIYFDPKSMPAKPYEVDPEISGKSYVCVSGSVTPSVEDPNSIFTIILFPDGSATFSQPYISSNAGVGSWRMEDTTLIIDSHNGLNYFDIIDGRLVYNLEKGSVGFSYYNISDGAVFERKDQLSEYFGTVRLPLVSFDEKDNEKYLDDWYEARFNDIMVSSFHYMGDSPSERVSIALYLGGKFIIDLPISGYAWAGEYTFDADKLILSFDFTETELVFDINDENWKADSNSVALSPRFKEIKLNFKKSNLDFNPHGVYHGLRDGMVFTLDAAILRPRTVRLNPYSNIVYKKTLLSENPYGKVNCYISYDLSDNMTLSISFYWGDILMNRATMTSIVGIPDIQLKTAVVDGKQGLYLTMIPGNSIHQGKTLYYAIEFNDGIMTISDTSKSNVLMPHKIGRGVWNKDLELNIKNEPLDTFENEFNQVREIYQKSGPDGTWLDYLYSGGYGYGGSYFCIRLNDDGNYEYNEGYSSALLGIGKWHKDGDFVIMEDENTDRINRFKEIDGKLVFVAAGSSNYKYLQLEDGAVFECFTLDK